MADSNLLANRQNPACYRLAIRVYLSDLLRRMTVWRMDKGSHCGICRQLMEMFLKAFYRISQSWLLRLEGLPILNCRK